MYVSELIKVLPKNVFIWTANNSFKLTIARAVDCETKPTTSSLALKTGIVEELDFFKQYRGRVSNGVAKKILSKYG